MLHGLDDPAEHITVVHLDDDPDLTDLTAEFLEREADEFRIITEESPTRALERIRSEEVDCIVCDYDMPEMDGLEFLEAVREDHFDLPFILFTGKGSEEIASEAISRGVTDYLQKGRGTDRYTVLANRIQNSVAQYRAEREVEQRSQWYQRILEHSSDYVMVVDGMGKVAYVSPAVRRVTGFTHEEITGTNSFENIHPDDLEDAATALSRTIENPDEEVTTEFRMVGKDGTVRWLEARGSNQLEDPIINGVMVNVRDISDRKEREQALERRNRHLEQLTNYLSHDVKNQLGIVMGNIELVRADDHSENLKTAANAATRIEEMIDKVGELANSGRRLSNPGPVEFERVVDQCREVLPETGGVIEVSGLSGMTFEADEERLKSLIENLLVNAIDHGGTDVTVTVGRLPSGDGFYVEDDGHGISTTKHERVFESDYTTAANGTGLGLAIVKHVADAHGWTISVTESDSGGARFEFTGVEPIR